MKTEESPFAVSEKTPENTQEFYLSPLFTHSYTTPHPPRVFSSLGSFSVSLSLYFPQTSTNAPHRSHPKVRRVHPRQVRLRQSPRRYAIHPVGSTTPFRQRRLSKPRPYPGWLPSQQQWTSIQRNKQHEVQRVGRRNDRHYDHCDSVECIGVRSEYCRHCLCVFVQTHSGRCDCDYWYVLWVTDWVGVLFDLFV